MWRFDDNTDLRVNAAGRSRALKHLSAFREMLADDSVNETQARIQKKLDLFSRLDSKAAKAARSAAAALGVAV